MTRASRGQSSAPRWRRWSLNLLLLALGLGLLSIGVVRYYPYPTNFSAFPRVTQTASGVAGDPINLIFVGGQDQITSAFQQAGWLLPDPITPETSSRIAAASIAHQAYPTAPISNLYAFGRVQDLAFEKPTNDVQYRGHIRLWKSDSTLDGQPVWIAQASYDAGIELSATNGFPTHHIAPAVDLERNAVGADLRKTGAVTEEADSAYTAPVFFARNGGGDFYESDGDALIINLTQGRLSQAQQPWLIGGLKTGVFLVYDFLAGSGSALIVALALVATLVLLLTLYRARKRKRGLA